MHRMDADLFFVGHGGAVTKAHVPIDSLLNGDLMNSTRGYEGEGESEVLFKGIPKLDMEVIAKQ